MIDCQQAFALLQEILDKEASQIDEEQVRAHLKKCKHCFEKFRIEESVQAFLNEKIKATASSDCKSDKLESLRMNLMTQLDEIDTQCSLAKKSAFSGSTFKIFLSTAALVVLVGIWFISNGFFHHNRYYLPFEQAHWDVADNITTYTNDTQKTKSLKELEDKYHYNLQTSFANYNFVGGNDEKILGTEFEHVVFSNDSEYISVFISNSDKMQIPSDLESTKISKNGIEFFEHNCPGCRLAYHKIGSLLIITATKSKDIELTDFVPGHLTI